MRKIIDPAKLREIAEQFGGWEKIVSPEYQPSEELLSALEEAGLDREVFAGSRIEATWTPRQRAIKHIARDFIWAWSNFLRNDQRHKNPVWRDGYNTYWNVMAAEQMSSFNITLVEIIEEVSKHKSNLDTDGIWNPDYVLPEKPKRESLWSKPEGQMSHYEEAYLTDVIRRLSRRFHANPKDRDLCTKVKFKISNSADRHQNRCISDIAITESSGNADFDESVLDALAVRLRPTQQDFQVAAHFQISKVTVRLLASENPD